MIIIFNHPAHFKRQDIKKKICLQKLQDPDVYCLKKLQDPDVYCLKKLPRAQIQGRCLKKQQERKKNDRKMNKEKRKMNKEKRKKNIEKRREKRYPFLRMRIFDALFKPFYAHLRFYSLILLYYILIITYIYIYI